MPLLDIVGSRVRFAVLVSLAKGYHVGVPVAPRSVARVFGVNVTETYRFMRLLASEGFAVRTRGGYVLTSRGARLGECALEALPRLNDGLDYLRASVPETMYYVFTPPFQSWFGAARPLVVIDKRLKGKADVRGMVEGLVVYASMRGRVYGYDWDLYVTRPSVEQGYADAVSYDPEWLSYIPDILLNLDRLDLRELMARATPEGVRRVATAIAYYEMLTGRRYGVPVSKLIDDELVSDIVSFVTPLVVDGRVLEARNI